MMKAWIEIRWYCVSFLMVMITLGVGICEIDLYQWTHQELDRTFLSMNSTQIQE